MRLWGRRPPTREADYPATIPGRLTLRTGDQIELLAHYLGIEERDDGPMHRYELRLLDGTDRLPITEADFLRGGIGLGVDLVPGRASMTWRFTEEQPPPSF